MLKLNHNPITGSYYYLEENSHPELIKEEINSVVKETIKNYVDPTVGMTLSTKKEFHKAMKTQVKKFKQKNKD